MNKMRIKRIIFHLSIKSFCGTIRKGIPRRGERDIIQNGFIRIRVSENGEISPVGPFGAQTLRSS